MTGLGNIDDVYKHYLEVIEENQQLKELLKECRDLIGKIEFCTPNCYKTLEENILTKIDNAIGEK